MTHQVLPLSERDGHILQAIYTYQYLTLAQITRLFFSARSQRSKNHAGQYLKRLAEEQWLIRFPLPATHKGNRAFVYTLGYMGVKYLHALGFDASPSSCQAKPAPSYQHLQHTLCLNDVLIAAALLPRRVPSVLLADMQHEWILKQKPLHVPSPDIPGNGRRPTGTQMTTVIPDAWLDFRLSLNGITSQTAVWLELDRGSEEQKQFRRKVRGLYEASCSETYRQEFGAQTITIAFATTAGEKRREQLRQWTKQELLLLQKILDADLLLFTSLPPTGDLDPEWLFLSPVWTTPLTNTPVPLLDLSEPETS
jgi:hypothetical protein